MHVGPTFLKWSILCDILINSLLPSNNSVILGRSVKETLTRTACHELRQAEK